MLNLHKRIVLDECQNPVAVQIPYDEFQRIRGDIMTSPIKLLDVVALTVDLPEHNLWRGQVGTVSHGNRKQR